MNTRTINKTLRTAGIPLSITTHSSRVRGWSNTSEGVEVVPDVKQTFSAERIRGKWRTHRQQTGVFGIIYHSSTYIGSQGNRNEPADILRKVYQILSEAFPEISVTLDLDGEYTIYGWESHESGQKVIVGDVKILSEKHF